MRKRVCGLTPVLTLCLLAALSLAGSTTAYPGTSTLYVSGVVQRQDAAVITLYVDAASQGYIGANLRAAPSLQATIYLIIPNGAAVQALTPPVRGANGQDWYQVTYRGYHGYVLGSLLSRQNPARSPQIANGSDWPMAGGSPAQTAFNSNEHGLVPQGLHVRWSVNTGDSLGQYIIVGGRVYVLLQDGTSATWSVSDFDAATGMLHGRAFGGVRSEFASGLAYAGGKLYVSGAELAAVDARSGTTLFSTHVSSPTMRGDMLTPVVSHGVVYTSIEALQVGGYIPRHYAIDGTTGGILWSVGQTGTTVPMVAAGRVYFGYADASCDAPSCVLGHSIVYDARTGRALWRIPESQEVQGQWLTADGLAIQFVISKGTSTSDTLGPVRTRAFTLTGRPVWTTHGFRAYAAAYHRVYGTYHGYIAALRTADGHPAWVSELRPDWQGLSGDFSGYFMPIVVANGVVYVAGVHTIAALDARTGRQLALIPQPPGYLGNGDLEVADGSLVEAAELTQGGFVSGNALLAFSQ